MPGEQLFTNRPLPGARLNMAHPLTRGLVGCWLLNETGGIRAMDLSPYGNHGRLVGFASPVRRPFNGLPFDGVDDYVDVGNGASLNVTGPFSIELWVKFTAYLNGGIIDKNYSSDGWMLWSQSDPLVALYVNNAHQVEMTSPALSVWSHTAAVMDSVSSRIYLGGVLKNTGTSTFPTGNSSDAVVIGKDFNLGRFSNVVLGIVRVYNRALNAQEIKELYMNPYGMILRRR